MLATFFYILKINFSYISCSESASFRDEAVDTFLEIDINIVVIRRSESKIDEKRLI